MCFASENSQNIKSRILIVSFIEQEPKILNEFLSFLNHLEKKSLTLDYLFFDNNIIEESRELLKSFSAKQKNSSIISSDKLKYCNNICTLWNANLIFNASEFKDLTIQKALEKNYDYLFLIDSDIMLHPKTLIKLIESKKDLISNIFYNKNTYDFKFLSQICFFSDIYSIYTNENLQTLTKNELEKKANELLNILNKPDIYKAGTIGCCSLISKNALKTKVSFKKKSNLPFLNEPSFFSLNASILGFSFFLDTHYPAFKLSKDSDFVELEEFKKKCNLKKPRITLSMIIQNEANRYLRKVLEKAKEYITNAVIIDDASTDNSAKECLKVLKGIPLHLIVNTKSKFSNEVALRKQQWAETIKTNPEWILILDADELFEDRFIDEVYDLITSKDVDTYAFRLFDFWDENHYRNDQYWQAHLKYFPFLIRYNPKIEYHFKEQALHCGRFPYIVTQMRVKTSDLRIKHFGWAKQEDRLSKYLRYNKLDPEEKYNWKSHESILDKNPNLIKWEEEEIIPK